MTVILFAPRKLRSCQQIGDAGETVGGRSLRKRVRAWLALPARLALLPFNVALALGRIVIALAVALVLALLLVLALPLLALASLAGRVARRQTGDNTALQVTENKGGGSEAVRANHKPGAQ